MKKVYFYEGQECIRVYDFLSDDMSDSDAIESAIAFAKESGVDTVLFDKRDYLIGRAILYFSGARFIVDGVMIKQADGTFDNVFRPENLMVAESEPYGYPLDIKKTSDFKIIGKNGARLEGPDVQAKRLNYVTGEMEETFGDIWGWRGFIAYFPMCEGFEFSGFYITKTRTWAISVEHSSGGYFGNIEFNTSCVNGDGLNLRVGCSHMVIENIFGKTADDFIALNTGASKCRDSYPITTWKSYLYPLIASECVDFDENERDDHTHDVKIRNVHVRTDHFSQGVAFLSRGGNKIFNIDIQGVYDENPIGSRIKSNLIGVYYMGFGQPNSAAMIENINIDTAVSNSYASAVLFREHVLDLTVKNVVQNAPEGVAVMARDEDIIEIVNCQTVSGVIRDSAINWKPITT